MELPNQPGHFPAQFIYRWDNSDKLVHFVLHFRFQSEISNIFIQIVIQKMPWRCRNQPFHSPPRRVTIQPPATETSGAGSPWQAPHLYTRMAVFEGNPSRPDRRKNSPADDPGCFLREIPLQIVITLQDYTDKAAAALVDDPFDGLLQLDAGVAGHPAELVVQPLVDQLMQALAEDV